MGVKTKSIGRGQKLETHVGASYHGDPKINKNPNAKGGDGGFGGGKHDLSRTISSGKVPGGSPRGGNSD